MKRALCIFLTILMILTLSGCKQENLGTPVSSLQTEETANLFPLHMYYGSGFNGFCDITLEHNGTFNGQYEQYDVQNLGAEYPNGTTMQCDFNGTFEDLRQLDETTFSLTFKEIKPAKPLGTEYIENGTRYIVTEPNGLSLGKAYTLYTPETYIEDLPEDVLDCVPRKIIKNEHTLTIYLLYNDSTKKAFYTE